MSDRCPHCGRSRGDGGCDWIECPGHSPLEATTDDRAELRRMRHLLAQCGDERQRYYDALVNIVALDGIPKADLGDAVGYAQEAIGETAMAGRGKLDPFDEILARMREHLHTTGDYTDPSRIVVRAGDLRLVLDTLENIRLSMDLILAPPKPQVEVPLPLPLEKP